MTRFIPTLKGKALWIVTFCMIIFIIYAVTSLNELKLTEPYAWFKVVLNKERMKEIDVVRNRTEKELESEAKNTQLTDTNIRLINNTSKNLDQSRTSIFLDKATASGINVSSNGTESRTTIVISDSNNGKIGDIHFKIAILIPATTRKIISPNLEKLSLTSICLPSIYRYMQMECSYHIYVGIEKGDYLETVKHKLEGMFDRLKVIVTPGKTFTKTVNDIARIAYRDGMDYLVRVNDDTSFQTKNWTSDALKVLQNYNPPDVGVVGPTCHEGNTAILTHDMVHRTHLEIFDFYYPPYFDNWWADDWITKVYDIGRSTKLKSWIVKHHVSSHGTRYNPDFKKMPRLNKTLTFDRERLDEYISNLKH